MKLFKNPNLVLFSIIALAVIRPWFCVATAFLPTLHGNFIEEFYTSYTIDLNKPLQASQWTVVGGLNPNIVSNCNLWFILGGLGTVTSGGYFQRIYQDLPIHNILYYTIYLIIINEWGPLDNVGIQFDSGTPVFYNPFEAKNFYGRALCEGGSNDLHLRIFGKLVHTSDSLTLKVISGVDGFTGAFGIHSVKILLHNDTSGQVAEYCTTYDGGDSSQGTTCPCNTGEYLSSGVCTPCDPSCYHCFGPFDTSCYSCNSGYFWDGNRCVSTSVPGCLIPLANNGKCSLCFSSHILSWDYTCITVCNSPMIQETVGDFKFCKTPCQDNNKFMLPDANCSTSCDPPLTRKIDSKAKFCDFPCNIDKYLYLNGTCSSKCSFVKKTEGNFKLCIPCQPQGHFMYRNGTCLPNCSSPLLQIVDGQYQSCQQLCEKDGEYYYINNHMCRYGCDYPYKVNELGFCVLDLAKESTDSLNKTVEGKNTLGSVVNIASKAASFANYANTGPPFVFALTELLEYIRYINVKYPPKLQYIFENQRSYKDLFPLVPDMPQSFENKFQKLPLPERFEYDQLHSSFFVTFWKSFIFLIFLVIMLAVILILFAHFKPGSILYLICEKFKQALKWNLIISLFITFYNDIILETSLELRTISFGSSFAILSLIACGVVNFLALAIFLKTVEIVKDIWKSKSSGDDGQLASVLEKYQEYQIIFECYKIDLLSQIAFIPFFIIRISVFSAVIAYLFDYPLAQAILNTAISVFIVIYLIARKPFKTKIELVECVLQEILILVVNLCVLILASLDELKIEALYFRSVLGDIIIICSFLSLGMAIIYLFFYHVKMVKAIYEFIKQYRKSKATFPITESLPTEVYNLRDLTTHQVLSSGPDESVLRCDQTRDMSKSPRFGIKWDLESRNDPRGTYLNRSRRKSDPLNESARPTDSYVQSSNLNREISWDDSYIHTNKNSKREQEKMLFQMSPQPQLRNRNYQAEKDSTFNLISKKLSDKHYRAQSLGAVVTVDLQNETEKTGKTLK